MAKRFYEHVGVKAQEGNYVVVLDERVLKTPGKQPLTFEQEFRAALVAKEWQAQQDEIKPETMPCTRLMNVSCELTPTRRPELVSEFRSYCRTDLLCYRTASPRDLARRQDENWQPILDWAAKNHGFELAVTTGLSAIAQPETSLNFASTYADSQDNAQLTLLVHFMASLGSSVLALALMEGHLDAERAFAHSRLDEMFQNERWGEDEEAMLSRQSLRTEIIALSALIKE